MLIREDILEEKVPQINNINRRLSICLNIMNVIENTILIIINYIYLEEFILRFSRS
jgi:hypothetical protein